MNNDNSVRQNKLDTLSGSKLVSAVMNGVWGSGRQPTHDADLATASRSLWCSLETSSKCVRVHGDEEEEATRHVHKLAHKRTARK